MSLRMMFSRIIHVVARMSTLFLLPNDTSLCGYVLFIHSSSDQYLNCFHFLAIMDNDAMNIHVQTGVHMFSILLGTLFSL